MLFPTAQFAIFFLVVFTVSWLLMHRPTAWKVFMLAASYLFYVGWGWRYAALLAASTLVNYAFGRLLARPATGARARKWLLALAVAVNLGGLAWFKLYGFFLTTLADVLQALGVQADLPFLEILVPVGISFFTFRAISYVVDIYRRKLKPAGLLDLAVYMAFFPYLAAGPIVRANELLPQLRTPRSPRRVDASRAFYLILAGLAKKIIIADFLARSLVDGVFATPGQFSSLEVLFGIYGYAVQIYCDFSAYTDIAIGIALLLGFQFPDNFNAPYTARGLRDFWRRWHMTLSRFLRDYLYIPLGGNQGSNLSTYRNIMLTMLLGGLWHGAAWTFVCWGGLHGLGLVGEHMLAARRKRKGLPEPTPGRWRVALQRVGVFHFVCVAWVLFRADSLGTFWRIMVRLFTAWGPAPAVTWWVVFAVVLGIGLQYVPRGVIGRVEGGFSRLGPLLQGALVGMAIFAIDALGPQGVARFIYFQF
jgi:alginate O-acetyltransferase complex protein AlgI